MSSGVFFDYILRENDNDIKKNYKNMDAVDHGRMQRFFV